jgi:hypothetical protein
MAKDDGQSSQLNLTVVALVALVAIVGLVALVLNTASLAKISTGAQVVSAVPAVGSVVTDETGSTGYVMGVDEQNIAGQLRIRVCYGTPFMFEGQASCNGRADYVDID